MMLGSKRAVCTAAVALAALHLAGCGGGDSAPTTNPAEAAAAAAAAEERQRALALPPGTAIPADAHVTGLFGPLTPWPLIAVHGAVMPDGRVLSYGTRETGQQSAFFIYDIWNPVDGTHLTLDNSSGTDIFCSSQVGIPGTNSIFIAGGDNWNGTGTTNSGNNNSNVIDGASNSIVRSKAMNRARWYSSSIVLPSGEIYIQGGAGGTDFPEVRDASGNFRLLSGAATGTLDFMYPRNFVAPDGRVFGYDGNGRMYAVNPGGTGSIQSLGQFSSAFAGSDSSAAMFAPGRILQFGGNSNQSAVIDITGATPRVSQSAPMLRQRRLAVATLLADGQVLATGGSAVNNQLQDVSYEAEIWNPTTGQWTVGAKAQKARLYHGNALLLPDASVLVFGGGAPGPQTNTNAEIYYPPYLFKSGGTTAGRPAISTAPTAVDAGRTVKITVASGRPIAKLSFVKNGSATHGFNMEQRFVSLPFAAEGNTLSVQIPSRAADIPPGMWMMFAIDDAGTPSVAKLVRVNIADKPDVATVPTLASPGNQESIAGTLVTLAPVASDPNGDVLRWSASGLPPGLSLNTANGRITGTPSTPGSYSVVLVVSDGYNSTNASFVWHVAASIPLVLAPVTAAAPSQTGTDARFVASATGQNVRYQWDFGDGTGLSAVSASGSIAHRYASPGTYVVTVIVRDERGNEQRQSFLHVVHLPVNASAPQSSSPLAYESRTGANARIWVVNPDNDSVSVFDAVTGAKAKEIAVGSAPRTIAAASPTTMWVVNQRSASISVIDTGSLSVLRTLPLPRASQPYGVVAAAQAGFALVTLEATGTVVKLGTQAFDTLGSVDVGPNPHHLALDHTASTVYVSRFITPPVPGESTTAPQTPSGTGGQVLAIDTATLQTRKTIVLAHSDIPDAENQGRGLPNYLGAAAISPDGTQAWVPSKLDNIQRGMARDGKPLNFQNTVRAASSRILMASQTEDLSGRIDHDNAGLASAATFDPLGVYLFVALETSREVAVIDAHRRVQLFRIAVGRAPQGLLVSPDRRRLIVSNFMDRSVDVFDLAPLIDQGLASVTRVSTLKTVNQEKLSEDVFLGKQFFYDAKDTRLARDGYMSCASCHQDGGQDGRVWDLTGQGEGLRNTISLRGRGRGHGRLHWSGNFDEIQDFEGQIRGLAGGTGLMTDDDLRTGTRRDSLGDAKSGVSKDLDRLAAYVQSLQTFDASPARSATGELTAAAQRGRTTFAARCSSCHGGTAFSNSDKRVLHDIGTLKTSSGQRLGLQPLPGIDTPTLRDVTATAPYLHDGSAPTLEAAIQAHRSITLSAGELADVSAYVRQIGSEEAAAPEASSNLVVRAMATIANYVGAMFEVLTQGQVIAKGQLDASGWVDLLFDTSSFAAGAGIDILFTNDAVVGGQDRNLAVDSITLNGGTYIQAASRGVIVDQGRGAGALDGVDTFEAITTGGWLPWDGAIRFKAPPSGGDRITVRAAATLARGTGAIMQVYLKGALIGTVTVSNTVLQDFSFASPAVAAGDRIDIVFTNDETVGSEDRNLYVAQVTARGQVLLPTEASAMLDVGGGAQAFDGQNVVAAAPLGGWIPWDAALRLVAR